jgi:hypothetical protein
MSEEFQEPPAAEEVPATKTARKRPAVRKSAKPKPEPERDSESAAAPAEAPATARESEPAARTEEVSPRESAPEVIPFGVETAGGEPPGNPKKRRRRKKKHGQGQGQGQERTPQQHPQQFHPHAVSPPAEAPSPQPETAHASSSAMHAAPRPKLDPEQVAKKAWKIFQAEVGEEGLALIDDHDAREISRRCFRLAEIFLEEASRRSR